MNPVRKLQNAGLMPKLIAERYVSRLTDEWRGWLAECEVRDVRAVIDRIEDAKRQPAPPVDDVPVLDS